MSVRIDGLEVVYASGQVTSTGHWIVVPVRGQGDILILRADLENLLSGLVEAIPTFREVSS